MKANPSLPYPVRATSTSRHGLRPLVLGLALSLAGLPLQASAQEGEVPPTPIEGVTLVGDVNQPRIVATTRGGVVLIPQARFEGATLGEVVDYLAMQANANVMVSPEVKDLPVPDVKVRNITGLGLLRAIADMGVPIQVNEMEPDTSEGQAVWVISPAKTAPEVLTNVTRIFNLRNLQYFPEENQSAEVTPEIFLKLVKDASDAINTALQAREEATKGKVHYPILKVHQATRLMVISGNAQEVEIAQQVVCALGGVPVE
ncbi:hypothetical protein [Haloferula sp. BvORR071]|uniref:hypothetical protein n=1 Tax=Haloferula sp. BvORR071 TaxID=1396141 RepID=UPI000551EAB3|nr:hypothetical protein [Haloferula sp. BvORR071]